MHRILIRGATIVDGSGAAPFCGDILTEGGRIALVGNDLPADGAEVLPAQGLTAAPGFIDGHSHNELQIMHNRQHACAITQGITTEVVGQCGLGVAPLSPAGRESMIRLYAGILGRYDPQCHNWTTFGDFLSRLGGAAVNVACPVSHSALRANAMGFAAATAEKQDLEQMAADAATAMREGAVGFSTGLTYYPAGYSHTDELTAICRAVKQHDGVFLVHKRDNFAYPRDAGDAEIVRVIRETGVRTHMLHYKTGPDNAGDIPAILAPYRQVLDEGFDISFEFYPFPVGAGFGVVFLPPWAMAGGYDSVMERLANKSLRARVEADTLLRYPFLMPADGATFAALKNTPEYEGQSFDQVCALRGQQPVPMLLDLLLENDLEVGYHYNPPVPAPVFETLEDDYFRMLDLPFYTVGSDSIAYGSHPHPRSFGTFPRLLRLARERRYPLEKLVKRITDYTANRYRLAGKGRIAPGMDADICLFDYGSVGERTSFSQPRRMAAGIQYVLVNGELALAGGQMTGLLAGKALKPTPIK